MKQTFEKGPWFVEYNLEDGARLSRLCYQGFDLLTTAPDHFQPPYHDYGEYENRPVYGYDDCFPSVEVSEYPGLNWTVPDHGELCWLKWDAEIQSNQIEFSVRSKALPIIFKRTLQFRQEEIIWKFEVENEGKDVLPFQHVIHPLVKLSKIKDLQFPGFQSLDNEADEELGISTAESLRNFLLSSEKRKAFMLYIQNPAESVVKWTYTNGLRIHMTYPATIFSSIGIWWNKSGYPDEDGCRRDECAFEPIPGSSSKLIDAYKEGRSLRVNPGEIKSWEITWAVDTD